MAEEELGEFWFCITCGDNKKQTRAEFREHLKTVHHSQAFKGTAKMTLHLDTAKTAVTYYECKLGQVEAQRVIVEPRHGWR